MASSYSYYDIDNPKHGSQEEKDNKSSNTRNNRNTAGESTPPQPNSDRKETRGGIFSRLGSQSEKSHDLRESIRHSAAQNDADVSPNKKPLKKGNSGRNLEESKGEISGSLDEKLNFSADPQNSSNSSQKDSKRLLKQLSEREEAAKNEEVARLRKERRKEKKERKKQLKAMEYELEKDAESADRSNKKVLKSPQNIERSPVSPLETASKRGNKNKRTNVAEESPENKDSKKSNNIKSNRFKQVEPKEEKSGRNNDDRSFENKESRRMKGSDRKEENKRERSRSQEKRNEKYKEQKKEQESQQQKKNSEVLNKRDLRDTVRHNDKDSGKKDIRDRLNKRDRSRERSSERNRDRDRDRDRERDRDRGRNRDKDRDRDRGTDRDWDRDRDRDQNRSDYRNRNRDRSRERSKERNRERSNERHENQQDRRSDRYNRDNRDNRDSRDYSDRRYSKPNINLNEGADSSEPESENFLKFPEDENAPKRKERRPMFRTPQYSESKGSFKNPDMTEEGTLSRLAPQKLTFAIDAECVSWKVDTEPQKEDMAVEVDKAVGAVQDENSRSLAATNSAKRSGEQHSNKKERSSNHDTDYKSCYKILGQERLFYTRETNLVTKLQDYLVETNPGEQDTKDEVAEEKKEDIDGLDEFYSFQNRYFIDNPTMVCRRCRRGGHFERMCPETLSIRCLFCCGQHLTSTCDSFICFRCNGLGHKTKDCTFSGGGSCYKCQKRGHKISQCGVLVSMKKNYNASLEEKREWKQETRCLCCERSNHINCNTEGIAVGTEKQVDDLYSEQNLLRIDREIEQLMSGGNSKENALHRGKTQDHPVLIEGSLHSSESDDETPKKTLNRSNTKTNQANSKQKGVSQNNASESGSQDRKNKKR